VEVYGYAINDAAQVVGMALTSSGQYHAFLYTVGEPLLDLGTFGGISSSSTSINNA